MRQLITLDLDGTLLNSKKEVSAQNQAILQKLRQQGHQVVLCTGRPKQAIQTLVEQLEFNVAGEYLITYNGGQIEALGPKPTLLYQVCLKNKEVARIGKGLSALNLSYFAVGDEHIFCGPQSTHRFYLNLNANLASAPLTGQEKESIHKIVISEEAERITEVEAEIRSLFGTDYQVVRTLPQLLEIAPKVASKEQAVRFLAQKLNFPLQANVAIGDEQNDLAMLAQAGLGIAMGNASSAVKKVADVVTKTNDEAGVAYALERWV